MYKHNDAFSITSPVPTVSRSHHFDKSTLTPNQHTLHIAL